MATYKVIQDIEAEDKLVGPLSLRQFIYAAICIGCLYLTFLVVTSGIAFMAIVFLPPALLFGFLAFPWRGDQPTEVWALAKIQFLMKPRRRIWNQSGVKELVTVTAPKKVERMLTNGLSQTEVKSRLKALADTIDSRGWVVKNVNPSMYNQPGFFQNASANSDRLVEVSVAQQVPAYAPPAADDMLDMQNNPVAQKFGSMIAASQKAHREQIMERMRAADQPAAAKPAAPAQPAAPPSGQPANDYWFLNQPQQAPASVPQNTVTFNTQVVTPGATPSDLPVGAAVPTADEEAFIKQHTVQPAFSPSMGHLHVVQPLSAQQQTQPQAAPDAQDPASVAAAQDDPKQQMTPPADAAILDLARNDDLNVATIAREAQKRKELSDEVVISLH